MTTGQPGFRQPDEIFCHNCGLLIKRDSRFCMHCGVQVPGLPDATGALPGAPLASLATLPPFLLRYEVAYPEKLSRWRIFVKWLLVIPHLLVLYGLGVVALLGSFFALFAILFTKRYPKGLFNLVVNINRWGVNVSAYSGLLRDEYPPFSWERGKYPVTFEVAYPETLNRWLPLVKWILVVPNQIVLSFLFFAAFFVHIIGWFAILFTGRFPRGMFNFIVGVGRWQHRTTAYSALLRDEYPPYSTDPDAKPGGRASIIVGGLVGAPYQAAVIAFFIFVNFHSPGFLPFSSKTHEVPVQYQAVLQGHQSPLVDVDGTDVVLVSAEDLYRPTVPLRQALAGKRYVAFVIDITNRDSTFTLIGSETFRLKDSSGDNLKPALVLTLDSSNRGSLSKGERTVVTAVFEIDRRYDPTELTYSPGFAAFLPFGERVRFLLR